MLSEGQLVGNYRVLHELGHGGMGAVFCAEHQYIGRRAAIKVLHPELSENPAFAARFLNEARAVNLVEHPGLVEIFEYGMLEDKSAYIIMEYLSGESLRQRIHRADWPTLRATALPIAHQIAQALAAAHACEIVHRDLKPDNVMLVADRQRSGCERVKVLDFGLAKMTASNPGSDIGPKTKTGVTMGTAEYMSPEQCKAQVIDGNTDTYALGVMLYEMLGGQLPFQAEFAFDLMRMHVYEEPRPLRELAPELPPEVLSLVSAMMAKQPAARPSMQETVARIERLCPDLSLYAPGRGARSERSPGAILPTLPGAVRSSQAYSPTMPAATTGSSPAMVASGAGPHSTSAIPVRPTALLVRPSRAVLIGAAGVALLGGAIFAVRHLGTGTPPATSALTTATAPRQTPPGPPPPLPPPTATPAAPPTATPTLAAPKPPAAAPELAPTAKAVTAASPTGADTDHAGRRQRGKPKKVAEQKEKPPKKNDFLPGEGGIRFKTIE